MTDRTAPAKEASAEVRSEPLVANTEIEMCPFCGCEGFADQEDGDHVRMWTVKCNTCFSESGRAHSEAEAIAAWNRRSSPVREGEDQERILPAASEASMNKREG